MPGNPDGVSDAMTQPPRSNRIWLLSYTLLYGLLAVVLLISLWQACHRSVFVEEPLRLDGQIADDSSLRVDGQIDPNTAEWQELSLLPGLSKTVSEQIVAYRQARQSEWRRRHLDQSLDQTPPVFVKPEDLLPVKGIGPRTLEKIRPYLRLPQSAPATQPTESAGHRSDL
jgi:hypothetical protein